MFILLLKVPYKDIWLGHKNYLQTLKKLQIHRGKFSVQITKKDLMYVKYPHVPQCKIMQSRQRLLIKNKILCGLNILYSLSVKL